MESLRSSGGQTELLNFGRFNEDRLGRLVSYSTQGDAYELIGVSEFFLFHLNNESSRSVLASAGGEVVDRGELGRWLVLNRGERVDFPIGAEEPPEDVTRTRFSGYELALDISVGTESSGRRNIRAEPTLGLLVSDDYRKAMAELSFRLNLFLASFMFCLLALPMSFSNGRSDRWATPVVAIATVVVANNLIVLLRGLVLRGEVSVWVAIVSPSIFLGLFFLVLMRSRGAFALHFAPQKKTKRYRGQDEI